MKPTPALLAPPARTELASAGRLTPPPPEARRGSPVSLYRSADDALMDLLSTAGGEPDLLLSRLGIARWQLRELEFDDEISTALETRRSAATRTPWKFEEEASGPAVDFVCEQLDTWIDAIMTGAWGAVPYGFSVLEAVWQPLAGGRVGLADIGARPLQWFSIKRNGSMLVQPPGGQQSEADLSFKWFLTRRAPTWENPSGEALLSRLYWPWKFRRDSWRYWVEFLERFGMPLVLGKVGNPKAFVDALASIGVTSAIGVGMDEAAEAITATGAGEFEKAEAALTRRIQKVILGQTLTTDVGGSGSYAAAKVHNDVRLDRRASDLILLKGTVQRVINAMWALNRFPGAAPKLDLEDEKGLEAERADRDAKLVQSGALKLKPAYFARAYDFEEDEIEEPAPPVDPNAPPPPADGADPNAADPNDQEDPPEDPPADMKKQSGRYMRLAGAGAPRFSARQQQLERIADAMPAKSPIDPALVRRAVLAAKDPEDLAERLARLMPTEPGGQFDEVLSRALFAADVLGYVQETEGAPADFTQENES